MENKKKFERPEIEIVEFKVEDIIVTSGAFGDPDPKEGDINGNGWW